MNTTEPAACPRVKRAPWGEYAQARHNHTAPIVVAVDGTRPGDRLLIGTDCPRTARRVAATHRNARVYIFNRDKGSAKR